MRPILAALLLVLSAAAAQAQGMSKQEMIQIQGLLSDMGYELSVDGEMGPGTAREIRRFEAERGLAVTGAPSADLLARLRVLHGDGWYRTGARGAAAKPSFDCARAGSATELAICGDASLAFLDRQLAEAYGVARGRTAGAARTRLADAQRRWMVERDRCGAAVQCLRFAMEARIAQLR